MTPTEPSKNRYQALDLWRSAVCLFVVTEHAAVALWHDSLPHDSGIEGRLQQWLIAPFLTNFGTPLFFVMSGYCIAASLVSHHRRGGHPMAFLAKRFWRVFPPYWIALLGFIAIVGWMDHAGLEHWHRGPYGLELGTGAELSVSQWIGNLTLTETWRPLVAGGQGNIVTRVAWSLCYQEQFYLVCFVLLCLCRTSLVRSLAIVTGLAFAFKVIVDDIGWSNRFTGTFPMLWHEFAIGLAVFWRLILAPKTRWRYGVELGLVLMAVMAFSWGPKSSGAASLFGLVLILCHRFDATWAGFRSLDGFRALGRCSYGIYLTHLPIVVLVAAMLAELGVTNFWARAAMTVPLSVILAVALGMLFSRHVESRFIVSASKPTATGIPVNKPRRLRGQWA